MEDRKVEPMKQLRRVLRMPENDRRIRLRLEYLRGKVIGFSERRPESDFTADEWEKLRRLMMAIERLARVAGEKAWADKIAEIAEQPRWNVR